MKWQKRKKQKQKQLKDRQEFGTRQNNEKLQFTPIPMSYNELYQSFFDTHVVSPFYLKPLQPLYPKWYDTNSQYDYHVGITGHSIENYTALKNWLKGSSIWVLSNLMIHPIQKIRYPIMLLMG
ncbi:hypothetical protein Gotri_025866 [Gossypium trilobum]|uniref:Uncharacterized protein n=1 Tax=Gossypium trilobum TaxID=34281 RepID=A0A7J9FL08_9ROSI|nr:hypothetical protein [Gossypium trilobum]